MNDENDNDKRIERLMDLALLTEARYQALLVTIGQLAKRQNADPKLVIEELQRRAAENHQHLLFHVESLSSELAARLDKARPIIEPPPDTPSGLSPDSSELA